MKVNSTQLIEGAVSVHTVIDLREFGDDATAPHNTITLPKGAKVRLIVQALEGEQNDQETGSEIMARTTRAGQTVHWKIHLPNLLYEILNRNENMGIFAAPFAILGRALEAVAQRAAQINDPILLMLMCRLTLFEEADPNSVEYAPDLVRSMISVGDALAEQEGIVLP